MFLATAPRLTLRDFPGSGRSLTRLDAARRNMVSSMPDRDRVTLPSAQPRAGSGTGAVPSSVDRDGQRAFESARRAAIELGKGLAEDDCPDWPRCVADPEVIERYRWLLVAMGTARATPGGLAIADLARRGYAIAARTSLRPWRPTTRALDSVGAVRSGIGLPQRYGRRWACMEQDVLRVDVAALPELRFVSAHITVRIKSELRREGHDSS